MAILYFSEFIKGVSWTVVKGNLFRDLRKLKIELGSNLIFPTFKELKVVQCFSVNKRSWFYLDGKILTVIKHSNTQWAQSIKSKRFYYVEHVLVNHVALK